ncbi:hypothetical protein [Streptomyces cellulosae]|uniref:hypothetical protein n=1 Tax=Streptomyces cellulosae TaxID=1968 RepID=UPI00068E4601|nr:hypothetical protein [Streptomyces cellulosae]
MARPPQHDDDAYGVPEVTRESVEFPGSPNVYHPRAEATPLYEAYADPAAAHGWQNAYDQTRELPSVAVDAPAPARGGAGRGRRRARRKPAGRPSLRTLVAVGAVGVSAVALIAGFSFSGSSSGGAQHTKSGGARSVPDEPTGPTGPTGAASSAGPVVPSDAPGAGATAVTVVGGTTADVTRAGATAPPSYTGEPTTGPTSAAASAVPASNDPATSGPGNSTGKGRGHGSTKGPK